MRAKKVIGWFVYSLFALYALQILVVVFWEIVPMERREVEGVRYEIRRGFGLPYALIPLRGVTPIVGNEPVRLITTHLASGRREENSYDIAQDVRREHPSVWPETR
jgi:hypothetical protein